MKGNTNTYKLYLFFVKLHILFVDVEHFVNVSRYSFLHINNNEMAQAAVALSWFRHWCDGS